MRADTFVNRTPAFMSAFISALVIAVGLAVLAAPVASADEHDDAFLAALKRDGIVPTSNPSALVSWAHWACDQLNQGAKSEHIVTWMTQYYPPLSLDFYANSIFLRKAALYYCPENKYKAGW